MADSILSLREITKQYPGTLALDSVSIDLLEGEIHAIVGENGAGKSTLIKILTSAIAKTSGRMLWKGQEFEPLNPSAALDKGIAVIHQEVVLCPDLSVAGNLFLGYENARFGLLRDEAMFREAQAILDRVGFAIDARRRLGDLTIGQQQLVATARGAARDVRLIIFDEPTAYLTRSEIEQLFVLICKLNQDGTTVVYISHRMEEVLELADRVSVLRDGRCIATHSVAEQPADTLTKLLIREMVARDLGDIHYKVAVPTGDELLRVESLSGKGFEGVSINVRQGELVGMYGLVGSGRSEFVETLFGRHAATAGKIVWKGREIRIRSEQDAVAARIALLPESRRDQGLCLNLPIRLNLSLASYRICSVAGVVRPSIERKNAGDQIASLRIKASSQELHAGKLSGGNQQKVVLGKWLIPGADLFIVDEPTVGVDVGTKSEIYKIFAGLLQAGAGIIMVSSYLPEIYNLSDRLYIFRNGCIAASVSPKDVSHEDVLSAAIGT